MTYKKPMYNRRSIRLRGYDYSQQGLYFITMCTQNRAYLFGNIVGANNHSPNNHSPNNHSPDNHPANNHLSQIKQSVMILNDAGKIANECWMAIPKHYPHVILHEYIIMPNHIHGIIEIKPVGANNHSPKNHSPIRGTSKTIGSVVRGFKIGVTKWMRQNTNVYDVWQRNYHEHIIRNEQSYFRITEYILQNPNMWGNDRSFIRNHTIR